MEGRFYTLFEKLRNRDSKFYNYFRMSIHTFDFLVDRATKQCSAVLPYPCQETLLPKIHKLLSKTSVFLFFLKTISRFVP